MNNAKGFTLIEMVIVIVVMGILSAVAIPKYISFAKETRVATMQALEGTVKTGSELVFAQSALNGTEDELSSSVEVQGELVPTAYGYPVVVPFDPDSEVPMPDVLSMFVKTDMPYVVEIESGSPNMVHIKNTSAENPDACYIRYQSATDTQSHEVMGNYVGC